MEPVSGITFISRADDYLLVRSFSGENIVETGPFSEVDGKKLRSVHVMDHEYVQHTSPAHSDHPVNHDTPLSHAIQTLISMKETTLLEEAAEAVGERGINGKNTPAGIPFFMFALRVAQLHTEGPYANNTTLTHRHSRQLSGCYNTCPPCPDDECYGQCGYGCTCWQWACGDCCYHVTCYDHDTCCREDFYQTRCLLPVGFSCEHHYSC